jgi:hypothetical protein
MVVVTQHVQHGDGQRGVKGELVRYRSFAYQAASWNRQRRVIGKVEHHFGELFRFYHLDNLLQRLVLPVAT